MPVNSTTFRCAGCQNRSGVNNSAVTNDGRLVCRRCKSQSETYQVGAFTVEIV